MLSLTALPYCPNGRDRSNLARNSHSYRFGLSIPPRLMYSDRYYFHSPPSECEIPQVERWLLTQGAWSPASLAAPAAEGRASGTRTCLARASISGRLAFAVARNSTSGNTLPSLPNPCSAPRNSTAAASPQPGNHRLHHASGRRAIRERRRLRLNRQVPQTL